MQKTKFFVIIGHFLPFDPPNNPKNWNFEKMKKKLGDIILHLCTTNDDHMMYGSWDIKRNKQFFDNLGFFCPLTPLAAQKIKISKKWKKCLEISSFRMFVPKVMIRWCTVPEIKCATDRRVDRQREKVTYRGGYPT